MAGRRSGQLGPSVPALALPVAMPLALASVVAGHRPGVGRRARRVAVGVGATDGAGVGLADAARGVAVATTSAADRFTRSAPMTTRPMTAASASAADRRREARPAPRQVASLAIGDALGLTSRHRSTDRGCRGGQRDPRVIAHGSTSSDGASSRRVPASSWSSSAIAAPSR